jgi:cell division protein FtsL
VKFQSGSVEEAGGRSGVALALVVVAIAVTAALVWMVRVKSSAIEAGYRIHSLRLQLVQLEQQQSALEVERTALSRPTRLAAIARGELGLVPPDVSTSIALPEVP